MKSRGFGNIGRRRNYGNVIAVDRLLEYVSIASPLFYIPYFPQMREDLRVLNRYHSRLLAGLFW